MEEYLCKQLLIRFYENGAIFQCEILKISPSGKFVEIKIRGLPSEWREVDEIIIEEVLSKE